LTLVDNSFIIRMIKTMDNTSGKSAERQSPPTPESPQRQGKRVETPNLPKQPFESTASKTAEYVELGESAEIAGEVSEIIREQSEQKGSGLFGRKGRRKKGQQKQMTAAQIKSQLLKTAPSQSTMITQVTKEIEKEIKYLNKRAGKIVRKPGAVNAFELNNIVKKIRELKALLIALAKATADAVKTLWLRFVHEVM
jgi:hypothetical protein